MSVVYTVHHLQHILCLCAKPSLPFLIQYHTGIRTDCAARIKRLSQHMHNIMLQKENGTPKKHYMRARIHTHTHTPHTHLSKNTLTQTYIKHKDNETHLLGKVCVVLLGDDVDHLVVLLAAGKIWSQTEHAHTEQHVIRHRQTALLVRK